MFLPSCLQRWEETADPPARYITAIVMLSTRPWWREGVLAISKNDMMRQLWSMYIACVATPMRTSIGNIVVQKAAGGKGVELATWEETM